MFTITKLKMWKNPGYTRQCVEVPPRGSWKLPDPDYTSAEDLRPRRGSTLSAIELPLSYLEVFEMCYLYIEATDSKNNTTRLFGWILSIEEIASANEAVRITWDPDYWRTYSQNAVIGAGTITRTADTSIKRPSSMMPRLWKVNKAQRLMVSNPNPSFPWWVIVVYNHVNNNISEIRTLYWNCSINGGAETYTDAGVTYNNISLADVFRGKMDEMLGLDPLNITGIFVSDHTPWVSGNRYKYGSSAGNYWCYWYNGSSMSTGWNQFSDYYTSDDMHKTVILDPNGTIVATLPWGYKTNGISFIYDIGTIGAYLVGYLADSNVSGTSIEELAQSGRKVTLPLLNAPFNENGWSSYNFSGARDYDKETAEIQRNQQAVSGLTSSVSGATGGAIAGAIAGGAGGPVGAIGGAILGTIGPLLGTGVNYLSTGYFNDKLQDAKDNLMSNQSANVISSAGGIAFAQRGLGQWMIVELIGDDVSVAEFNNLVSLNGYTTDHPVTSASTFIDAGGPIQIQNLVVTGSIPPEAKTYIKNILSNGVRIVENNPAGVNP